jgi:hypothetical protein
MIDTSVRGEGLAARSRIRQAAVCLPPKGDLVVQRGDIWLTQKVRALDFSMMAEVDDGLRLVLAI